MQICLECFAQKLQALVNHCNVLHRVSPLMSLSCLCVHTDLSGLLYPDRSDVMHRVEHLHHVQSGRLSHWGWSVCIHTVYRVYKKYIDTQLQMILNIDIQY